MFVTLRSYTNCNKAEYIKYRLERVGVVCKTISEKDIFKVEVSNEQVETAVNELLKVNVEYPKEDFKLTTDPSNLLRLLIPVDFSEKSIEACKYALDLAAHRPVEIKFLHVWDDEIDDFMAVKSSREIEEFKRIQRGEIMQKMDKELDNFRNIFHKLIAQSDTKDKALFHFSVVEGNWKKQLNIALKGFNPQLVIIAHNTDTENKFRISRSVAGHVVSLAICPVFYIPQKVYYQPLGDLHVMYATNFDREELNSFKVFQELAVGYTATIHFLHVCKEIDVDQAKLKLTELESEIEELKSGGTVVDSKTMTNSNLMKGFESYIENNKIDIIAFTSPEHGMWHKLFNPDNLKNMMRGSILPLLIFRYKQV